MDGITNSSPPPPHQAPGLLNRLVNLTSIRDTDLLEQSLVKTISGLIGLSESMLYRTDHRGSLSRVIQHRRSQSLDPNGTIRIVDGVEDLNTLQDITSEVLELMNQVREQEKSCSRTIRDRNLVAYPMNEGEKICGFLVFSPPHELSAAEDLTIRGILEVFANYSGLLDVSQRDQLTGLLNRQALQLSFNRVWSNVCADHEQARHAATDDNSPAPPSYWVGVIDIDFFKRVNDTYGHIVGDEILLLVSRQVSESLRSSDLVYRYGGEEFVVITTAHSKEQALMIFERLRSRVEERIFPKVGKVTISIGVCSIDVRVLPQEALSRADRSLYEAKQQGRNRVCEYGTLLERGIFKEVDYGNTELF
jgi:diguanylate cyclase (GGDEF)-like protein